MKSSCARQSRAPFPSNPQTIHHGDTEEHGVRSGVSAKPDIIFCVCAQLVLTSRGGLDNHLSIMNSVLPLPLPQATQTIGRAPVLNWDDCPAVSRSPDVMSGALVFKNSRLPIDTLFGNLEAGATIDDFLDWYEGVSKKQVQDVIQFVMKSAKPNENSF